MVPQRARSKGMKYWEAEEAKEWKRHRRSRSAVEKVGSYEGSGASANGGRGDGGDGNVGGQTGGAWEGEKEEVGLEKNPRASAHRHSLFAFRTDCSQTKREPEIVVELPPPL